MYHGMPPYDDSILRCVYCHLPIINVETAYVDDYPAHFTCIDACEAAQANLN